MNNPNSDNTIPAIQISGLSKVYSNGVKALDSIDLSIPQGEFFALLGSNGAGKTTTINVMTDLVRKTTGTVKIFGVDIDKDFVTAKTMIGIVPQEFNFGIFEKVIDIVTTQAGYYGIPYKIALPKAKEVLTRLGLESKMYMKAMTLSGGMKRRLMIARALIHEPKLLILDEPTAGVDVELRLGMWDYLKDINQNKGVTVLLTTHYLEEVEQLCNRAAIIKQGKIVKLDSVKNLISSLDKEDYVVNIKDKVVAPELFANSPYPIVVIDNETIDVTLDKGQTLNDLISYFTTKGVIINGIRPKGNRLETLFIETLNSK